MQVSDAKNWLQHILVSNTSGEDASGTYKVWDADSGETFASGSFAVGKGDIVELASVKVCTTQQHLLLISWQLANGTTGVNHALCGTPQFDLARYRNWLTVIAGLDGSFDAATVAK